MKLKIDKCRFLALEHFISSRRCRFVSKHSTLCVLISYRLVGSLTLADSQPSLSVSSSCVDRLSFDWWCVRVGGLVFGRQEDARTHTLIRLSSVRDRSDGADRRGVAAGLLVDDLFKRG